MYSARAETIVLDKVSFSVAAGQVPKPEISCAASCARALFTTARYSRPSPVPLSSTTRYAVSLRLSGPLVGQDGTPNRCVQVVSAALCCASRVEGLSQEWRD